jgi:transposase
VRFGCFWITRASIRRAGQPVTSIAIKIGCTPQTLHDWVKKAEIDSGQRAGVPTEMADKLKALERENRGKREFLRTFCF